MKQGSDQTIFERGLNAARVGLAVQIAFSVMVAVLAIYADSAAIRTAMWHLLGGLPIWIVLILIYQHHRQERLEALEAEALAASGARKSELFEADADELSLTRVRLERLYRWGLPIVSALMAVYLFVIGLTHFQAAYTRFTTATLEGASNALLDTVLRTQPTPADPLILMVVSGLAAFGLFAIARYLAGMTKVDQWRLLRGGSAFLLGNCVSVLGVFVGTVMMIIHGPVTLAWVTLILPAFLMLLGLEIAIRMLTSVYRPRKAGEMPEAAFESWILGWLTSPQSLAKIVNQTINYQFGFEISKSWFYQLLGRAITPLVIFGAVVLLLISSVVVVQPHQEAMRLTFGRMDEKPLQSGISFKWPWPVGRVIKKDVGRVQQMFIGSIISKTEPDQAILWTNQHTVDGHETYLLSAPTVIDDEDRRSRRVQDGDEDADADGGFSGVALVAAEIVLQYRIRDLGLFLRTADRPEELLRAISEQEVNRFFAGRTIDQLLKREPVRLADGTSIPMGRALQQAIERRVAVDDVNMGIEVVLVSVTNVHPPQADEVAEAFHMQIGAMQQAEQMRLDAQNQATQIYSAIAGDVATAQAIAQAIEEHDRLEASWNTALSEGRTEQAQEIEEQLIARRQQIEDMLNAARGEAAARIYSARAFRWEFQLAAEDFVRQFEARREAYRRAPDYFIERLRLDALRQAVGDSRKYILSPGVEPPIQRLDLKETVGLEGLFDE